MTWQPAPPRDTALEERFRIAVLDGASQADLIRDMRCAGLTVIACIKLVRDLYGLHANEAKAVIHSSEAWADMRSAHERLHEYAHEAAAALGV